MPEYIVTRPWFGVKAGQRITIEGELHPSLRSNVGPVGFVTEGANIEQLTPEAPLVDPLALAVSQGSGQLPFDWETVRAEIISELDDGGVVYEEDAPAAELALLLDEEIREGIRLAAE